MTVLVVGGGGREHTLAWKIAHDSSQPDVFCAPGNAGTESVAVNLQIGADDLDALLAWAKANRPDLTVVGPEAPLCAGIADAFEEEGLPVFGPSRAAARLEGSKVFAKEIMQAAGVPTGAARTVAGLDAARAAINEIGAPLVVKADGLAAGKGVFVCSTIEEAENAAQSMLEEGIFGESGSNVLVEEMLEGEEASILALIDGENVVMLASSQDHKRVFNNDQGPNTGGMGAYSPAPVVTERLWPVIREDVFDRTLAELKKRDIIYRGVLYAGIMVTADGPKVLEFNCRFGDPETQAILPRIDGDLLPALKACATGGLREDMLKWRPEACTCVVMASGGYPGSYEKGKRIEGLAAAEELDDVVVFHAGTARSDGNVVTAGGRVLGVTALGDTPVTAAQQAYRAVSKIRFDQAQYRTDIAARATGRV